MGKLIKCETGDYKFCSDKGIMYDLEEGVGIGERKLKSDVLYIWLDSGEYMDELREVRQDDLFVSWIYGATTVLNDDKYTAQILDAVVEKWESSHTRFVNACNPQPFTDDEDKMADFIRLSKEEFLESYSYLTENEYEATIKDVAKIFSEMKKRKE